jgi:hypothetical protein
VRYCGGDDCNGNGEYGDISRLSEQVCTNVHTPVVLFSKIFCRSEFSPLLIASGVIFLHTTRHRIWLEHFVSDFGGTMSIDF